MAFLFSRSGILFSASIAVGLLSLTLPTAQAAENSAKPANPLSRFTQVSATMEGGAFRDEVKKIYRSGNLLRVNLDDRYQITDLEKGTTWVVRPNRCTHLPGFDARSFPFSGYRDRDYAVERVTSEEKETVDGHLCRIATATFTPKAGPPAATKMTLWEAEDLHGFPIKIEVVHPSRTMTVRFRDVSIEPPDPKLFALPSKCPDFRADGQIGKTTAKTPAPTPKKPVKQQTKSLPTPK